MNMASVKIGLVALPPADAYVLQAFIIWLKASRSLSLRALRKPSQRVISVSKACLYDGTVLPMYLHLHEVCQSCVVCGELHSERFDVWMILKNESQDFAFSLEPDQNV